MVVGGSGSSMAQMARLTPSRSAGSVDLLVAQELRPGAIGRLGEVGDGPLPGPVPAGRRLLVGLPEEREADVRVAEDDHAVAPLPTSSRARVATVRAAGASGSQPLPRASRGERPSSALRGRSHQRRRPMAL